MKQLKNLVTAGALALALVNVASATTLVKITGSTAFRSSVIAALYDTLSANGPVTAAYYNADATGPTVANSALVLVHGWTGTNDTAHEIYYQVAWSGAYGGVSSVATGATTLPQLIIGAYPGQIVDSAHTWLSTTTPLTTMTGQGAGGNDLSVGQTKTLADLTTAGDFAAASAADVGMGDTSIADYNTGGFPISVSSLTPASTGHSPAGAVGVVPFTWAKGQPGVVTGTVNGVTQATYNTSYANLKNISYAQAQELFQLGTMPLSAFTGLAADNNVDVILTGRNNDSGTRFDTLAETFAGTTTGPVAGILQCDLQDSTLNTTTTINDVSAFYSDPTNGYASGGFLSKFALNIAPSNAAIATESNGFPFILVSYLGISDNKNVNSGANALTWNGAGSNNTNPTTNEFAAITQGAYSFWDTEYMYYRTGFAATTGGAAMNTVAAKIYTTDANVAGLTLPSIASTVAKTGSFALPVPQLP